MKDYFKDILSSIRMSRRRGILSGIMTVCGVFIFICVVGTSKGVDRGNRSNYDYLLQFGMISVYPGHVSIPNGGLVKGREIYLTRDDAQELKTLFSERSQYIYPRKQFIADCESMTGSVSTIISDFRRKFNEFYLNCIAGREFTEIELTGNDRICIIPEVVAVQLFGSVEDAVGKTFDVYGLPYKVLGVYRTTHNVNIRNVFVPFETAMAMNGDGEKLTSIDIKLYTDIPAEENFRLKNDVTSWLYSKKGISADDVSAIRIENSIDFVSAQEKFLDAVNIYTMILGLFSLLMGILGVSSIVHISVKERTKEIAVRLVCGSSQFSIFRLILGEAVMIMMVFGIVGMLLGSATLNLCNLIVDKINVDAKWIFIGDMTVSWQLILSSTVLIIVCGLIAGFAPARKATSIRINEAMSCE